MTVTTWYDRRMKPLPSLVLFLTALVPAAALEIGDPAPVFELRGLDGATVKSSDLAGTVVLLDFWATWCKYCRRSLPHVQEIAQRPEVAAGRLRVFAVSVDDDEDAVRDFVAEHELVTPVLLDPGRKVGKAYGATKIPRYAILAPDQTIAWAGGGSNAEAMERLDRELDRALDAEESAED